MDSERGGEVMDPFIILICCDIWGVSMSEVIEEEDEDGLEDLRSMDAEVA